MAQNFGAATTYTCIAKLAAREPGNKLMSCYVTDDRAAMANPGEYFVENCVLQPPLSPEPWVVMSSQIQRLKDQVESQGIPLGKWRLHINYGIKTGFNDAFYLSQEQADALIDEDPNSIEVLKKLLRGRDVGRYKVEWKSRYQIVLAFGSHKELVDHYPAVYRHLQQFETPLRARGQCKYSRATKNNGSKRDYPGQHHWLELDNNPSEEYLYEFSKPKIMYPNMTKYLPFYLDLYDGYVTNDKGYVITSDHENLA
jgi:hypothetical protein